MIRLRSIATSFLILAALSAHAQLVVNEWMSKNRTGITDEDGDYSDWLEIYNGGSTAVNLGGYGLTDDAEEPGKWIFPPSTIEPNGHLLVFCSGKDRFESELHTNFKLSENDEIVLTDLVSTSVHNVLVSHNTRDVSEGLTIDGASSISEFYQPTPNASNVNGVIHNRLELSHQPGFYPESFELTLSATEPHTVRYTLDGSIPTTNSPVYSTGIAIVNRTSEPINLASIPTTAPNLEPDVLWEAPTQTPFRGTVVRLRSFNGSQPTSHTVSGSYFINPLAENRYSLPIVSIITDSLNLFQYDTGIFIPGYHHDIDPDGGHHVWGSGNYHQAGDDWEREAHIELFSTNGELEVDQEVGIRVHGSGSRAYPQKSIRLYARQEYGYPKIDKQIFPEVDKDEFDVLVLRNFGQDFVTGVAQDVLANRIIKNMNQARLADRAVITFINGEYWGIQNLRERFDKHFLSDLHELNEDSIDIIDGYYGGVNMGDNDAYFQLYDFIEEHDFSVQSNYDQLASMMDIEDFIDNTLTRIYLGCYDWPGNNVRMWREKSPEGKFRWLLLDNDRCLGNSSYNSLEHATQPDSPGWPNPPESTLFLRRLLMNAGFRQQFISRMAELLNTELNKVRLATHLSDIYQQYQNSYHEHDARWSALDTHISLEESYQSIIDVVEVRSCYVKDHFVDYFELSESEFDYECDLSELTLSIEDPEERQLLVYPNPNNGRFDLVFSSLLLDEVELTLIDIKGSTVYSKKLAPNRPVLSMDVSDLSSGLYVLKVVSNNRAFTQKIILR